MRRGIKGLVVSIHKQAFNSPQGGKEERRPWNQRCAICGRPSVCWIRTGRRAKLFVICIFYVNSPTDMNGGGAESLRPT